MLFQGVNLTTSSATMNTDGLIRYSINPSGNNGPIKLKQCIIDANGVGTLAVTGDIIAVDSMQGQLLFEDCQFIGKSPQNGEMSFTGNPPVAEFIRCTFTNMGKAIYGNMPLVLTDCVFTNCLVDAAATSNFDGRTRFVISKNTLHSAVPVNGLSLFAQNFNQVKGDLNIVYNWAGDIYMTSEIPPAGMPSGGADCLLVRSVYGVFSMYGNQYRGTPSGGYFPIVPVLDPYSKSLKSGLNTLLFGVYPQSLNNDAPNACGYIRISWQYENLDGSFTTDSKVFWSDAIAGQSPDYTPNQWTQFSVEITPDQDTLCLFSITSNPAPDAGEGYYIDPVIG